MKSRNGEAESSVEIGGHEGPRAEMMRVRARKTRAKQRWRGRTRSDGQTDTGSEGSTEVGGNQGSGRARARPQWRQMRGSR